MTTTTLPNWSAASGGDIRIGRRGLLVLSASAAAALMVGGSALLVQPMTRVLSSSEFVRALSKTRWGWQVELAVLQRLDTDRKAALDLLWAALELDLDPTQRWRRKHALRLYDLYAAASDEGGRMALAALVRSRSNDTSLLSRARRWSQPIPERAARLWRTIGPDRQPLGILLGPA
jgi:hypothetical protein